MSRVEHEHRVPEAVAFDVMGTLFDLSSLDDVLARLGAQPQTREAWFERLLHAAASLTIVGRFEAFDALALATLRSVLAQQGLDPAGAEEVVSSLAEVDAYSDAEEAVETLVGAGIRVFVVTNGGREQTETLLERAALRGRITEIVTTEEVRAYKPARALYERAAERAGVAPSSLALVAAHGWDVVGAEAAGLEGVWVDRTEKLWPFPFDEPRRRAPTLVAAARLLI